MLSLHLTGSPWFLLLLPPGLFILWRQYGYGSHSGQSGPRAGGWILFGLQALALLLLTLSLTAPELRRHRVEFHNPAVLILRDQSGSFRDGAYLGLGSAYASFEKNLTDSYRARKFDVKVADFRDRAWAVTGFPKAGRPGAVSGSDESSGLTSLAAAADFVDSAAIPNLQAIFLFSDGRANLDSGQASRTWGAPLFPAVFNPDSIGEVQPGQVSIAVSAGREGVVGGSPVDVSVAFQPVGRNPADVSLRLLQDGKVLLNRKLAPATGAQTVHFAWVPGKSVLEGKSPVRAILQPAAPGANFDTFNDTVTAVFPGGRNRRSIFIVKPIRSLDEKGMIDILSATETERVVFVGMDELAHLPLTPRDQVWLDAGALPSGSHPFQSGPLAAVSASSAKLVLYARPGSGSGAHGLPALSGAWHGFTPGAEITAGKSAADAFPDEVVRVKGLSQSPLEAPEAGAGASRLVDVAEGGKRAMLMGRIALAPGRRALFFVLPGIWSQLFDPQADFATRGNISAYVRAAEALADQEDGSIQVTRPLRVYHDVPFAMEIRLPEPEHAEGGANARKEARGDLRLNIAGSGSTRNLPPDARENPDGPAWKSISLPQGAYRLALLRNAVTVWTDSLIVAPGAALELARIGFDLPGLEEAASRSGGRVLRPDPKVTYTLPNLPNAQIRMEKTQSFRLYNTLPLFIIALLLLSCSWLLRKKWDID